MNRKIQSILGVILSFFMVSESWALGSSGLSSEISSAKALGQGNAFAGEANDPSAVWYNAAGITQLKGTQLTVGAAALVPMTTRTGEGVAEDKMKSQLSVLPNFYLTHAAPLGQEKISLGLGLNTPYGLTTDWPTTGSFKYITTESNFGMVNINPTVAYAVSSQLSFAVGADYVNLFNTTSKSQVPQALLNGDSSEDGTANLSGHGSGWGYNVAAMFKPAEKHSFGLSYRSKIQVPVKGSIELTNLSASTQADYNFDGPNYSAGATTDFTLPAAVLFGYAFQATEKLKFLADYQWTQWNVFQSQDIAINETDSTGGLTGLGRLGVLTGNGTNVTQTSRNWHNTNSFGLGANYMINDAWQVRGGYAYYEKTVPNDTFTPDVPDATNHLLSTGLTRTWESFVLNFAFGAFIYPSRSVSNSVGSAIGSSVNGSYHTFVPTFALDLTYKFGR
jgi:long-chain fatty acid transport protein